MYLDREKNIKALEAEQRAIVYESDEDEGAAEYYGEIQSVIDVLKGNTTDKECFDAANWVGIVLH